MNFESQQLANLPTVYPGSETAHRTQKQDSLHVCELLKSSINCFALLRATSPSDVPHMPNK